jgi:hypothetical protein
LAAGQAAAIVSNMIRARPLLLVALLDLSGFAALGAGPADETECRAARDRALEALANETISIESALDYDTAISGAPEYLLEEARDALIADIDRERAAVRERYRRCVAEKRPGPAQ